MTSTGALIVRGTKIRRLGDYLVGYSGASSTAEEFFLWVKNGLKKGECPFRHTSGKGGIAMVIHPNKEIWVYDHSSIPFRIDNTYHAIGAGQEAAMSALYLKHTAVKAVEATIAVNLLCGGGVDKLEFRPSTRRKT